MDEIYDSKRAASAQEKYCDEHHYPNFAPRTGKCYRCGRNIYIPFQRDNKMGTIAGYSVQYASEHLITGCPHCCYSFVE